MKYNVVKKNFINGDEFDYEGYMQARRDNQRDYRNKHDKAYRRRPEFILKRYVYSAKKRGIGFYLDDNQFDSLILSPCYYCNELISYGVDRVDSNEDYTISNCRPCCGMCNKMKYVYNEQEFIQHITKIYNRFNIN